MSVGNVRPVGQCWWGSSTGPKLADPADAHDFLGAFGLTTKDAPTMVIHDTAAGVKRALGEPLTKASAWRFVRGFLASQGAHDEL